MAILTYHLPGAEATAVFGGNRRRRTIEIKRRPRKRRRKDKASASVQAPSPQYAKLMARVSAVLDGVVGATDIRPYAGNDAPADGAVQVFVPCPTAERQTVALVACRRLRQFGLDAIAHAHDTGVRLVVVQATDAYDPWHKRIIDGKPFA